MIAAPAGTHRLVALVAAVGLCLSMLLATPATASPADAAPPRSGYDPHVVGGSAASASRYPWFAQLQVQTPQGVIGCGGALVTPVVVLTAAHCLEGASNAVAAFGQDQTGTGGQVVGAVGATIAADYNRMNLDNDYGFLALSQPVTAYSTIKLAGPSETALWRPGRVGTAMGFGKLSEGGASSPTLQHVALPVLADSVCGAAAAYGTVFRPASMLCVGYPQGGRSTCQGDSGGPLAVPADGGTWRIAGLVSFAEGCARPGYPTVFTRAGDPAYGARIQLALNDFKARNSSFFPGIYSATNIIGSGARPPGCGTARAAADRAATTATKRAKALKTAKGQLTKANKQLKKAKKKKSKSAVKAANAKVRKARTKHKKAKKAAVAAARASARARGAATAACS